MQNRGHFEEHAQRMVVSYERLAECGGYHYETMRAARVISTVFAHHQDMDRSAQYATNAIDLRESLCEQA